MRRSTGEDLLGPTRAGRKRAASRGEAMMAGTRAELNEDSIAEDEGTRSGPPRSEPDAKLEDAVRRSMHDLEQELRGNGDAGRARPSAS
jgi:hypothetical protein